MRQSGKMYESNSESEGTDLFRPRKTVNEPPSPDLKRRSSRQRASSRDGTRTNVKGGDDMKHVSSEKENAAAQLEERQRREPWDRQAKNLPVRSVEGQIPRRTRANVSTLDTFSSAESESFLGHRLRLPSSTAGDSGRHNTMLIKQEVEETPPKRQSSRNQQVRSSSRASPSQAATNSSAAKKLSNFKAAEKAGRTICVCGASAYYERERFALLKEKAKLKEDQQALREESKRVMENHRKVKEEIFECEKKRNELESCGRSLQRSREMQQEEAAVLEQSRRQLQKLKDQIEKDKDALQRTQQDLILKGEEFASRKSHLERLQQDLKSKKAELEERSIQIKKQAIKNESIEATLEMESHKLATLQSELALESEQIKQREATLRENEGRYEEKRRMLQSLESRLNHEVSMNEEKMKYLEEKEAELQRKATDLEAKEAELKRTEQELDRQKQELSNAKTEFEFQRQRELESIENEKKAAAVEIQLSKEDCAAFIELEKEWISQEKENLSKHKEGVQIELAAEREHMQQMMVQMRKRNHEAIAEEKEEWKREQQRITESRNRQRLELESMREALSQKEYELVSLKEALASEREQLDQEKAALESFKEIEMKKLQAEKTESLKLGQQIRKERQNCAQIEAQLKGRASAMDAREEALNARDREMQQQWQNLSRVEVQWENRNRELETKAKHLAVLQQELNDQKESLIAREKRLTNSEAQAAWLKEIYAELKEKKEAIAAQEKRLEMEKMAILEQRQSLLQQHQQQAQQRGTPSHASSARIQQQQQRSTPKRFPGKLCRRYSTSGLPQLQTVLPPHSRLASFGPVITVSSGDEGSNRVNRDAQEKELQQTATPEGQVFPIQTNPPSGEVYDVEENRAASMADFDHHVEAAEWSMFTAFDDASEQGITQRDDHFMQTTKTSTAEQEGDPRSAPPSHFYGKPCDDNDDDDDVDPFRGKRLALQSGAGLNDGEEDDISLSSREHHLLRQFGDASSFEAMASDTGFALAEYETSTTTFVPQKAPSTSMARQLSPPLSSFRSKASPQGSDHSSTRRTDTQQLLQAYSSREGTKDIPDRPMSPEANQVELPICCNEIEEPRRDDIGGSARQPTSDDDPRLEQDITDDAQNEFGAGYGFMEENYFGRREGLCTHRSQQQQHLTTSSRSSSPLMCTDQFLQEQDGTPSHDGSVPAALLDPSLSAPTTSPVGRHELNLQLANIDFDSSIGPSISKALLVNCTDEVRESIEHTIQMTYGSSHRSWQEEQDAYKSINKSLEVLSSSSQCGEAGNDVQKVPSSKSLTTSERTTTGAHENEVPSNSVWE